MRHLTCLTAVALFLVSAPATAQETRRPGLGGAYTSRNMSAPYNSLGIIAGPGQPQLFGQRYGSRSFDGGGEVRQARLDSTSPDITTQGWFHGGVVFGLTENLEAGALFLNFRVAPDFGYSDFPVYINYSWRTEHIDIGARFSFTTPAETAIWALNPGVPVLVRLGDVRIDAGVFVPMFLDSPVQVGINVPVRVTTNITPRFFAGLESGVVEPSFGASNDVSAQLGALVGYTTVMGPKVVDFTTSFVWDDFLLFSPAADVDTVQIDAFRVNFGVTFHKIVM